VSFTFDDGDADQLMAARVLRRYRMDGTFYIITGAVGTPDYLTLTNLRTLAADGDEIGGHTVSHLELPHVAAAEARRQVCDGRNTLLRWGFRVTSFAYPGGSYSPAAEAIVAACGFDSARTVAGLHSPGCPRCTAAEAIPPADPDAIRAPGQVDGTWTLADLEDVVTNAERHGGGWLPLIFHHICVASCSGLDTRVSLLNAFARWLSARQDAGTVVQTVGQVVGGPLRPAVRAAAARPHGVVNSSLATLGNSGAVNPTVEAATEPASVPLCWEWAAYGRNTVTWERLPGGHDSRWAMRLTMTSHTSGDAKLIQQFDLGQCSIPVTAGRSYDLTAWYKSSVFTQFSVYYRLPSGRWTYWMSSPYYRATAAWVKAAYTTPPLPAAASGLSFGLTLSRAGSLVADDYGIRATPRSITRGVLDLTLLALFCLGGGAVATRAMRRRRRATPAQASDNPPEPHPEPQPTHPHRCDSQLAGARSMPHRPTTTHPEPPPTPTPKPHPTPKPQPEPAPQPEPTPTRKSRPVPKPKTALKPRQAAQPKTAAKPKPAPKPRPAARNLTQPAPTQPAPTQPEPTRPAPDSAGA
jgi:peptidoglycan/xylan/chitin deacetylase (PgdA/CDA1 family)